MNARIKYVEDKVDRLAYQLADVTLIINKKWKNRYRLGMEPEEDVVVQKSASSASNREMVLQCVTRIQTGTHFIVFVTSMETWMLVAPPNVGMHRISAQKLEMLDHRRTL